MNQPLTPDASFIAVSARDSNEDLMKKAEAAFPRILHELARRHGEQTWQLFDLEPQDFERLVRQTADQYERSVSVVERSRLIWETFTQLQRRRDAEAAKR